MAAGASMGTSTHKIVLELRARVEEAKRKLDSISKSTKRAREEVDKLGKAEDDSGIYQVLVNGSEATVSAEGIFESDLILNPGVNSVTILVLDNNKNITSYNFDIEQKQGSGEIKPVTQLEKTPDIAGTYHALIIGVNDYPDPEINDLDHPQSGIPTP